MARGPARPRARRPPLSAMDARNCSLRLCGREYRDYRPAGWRHASILRKGLERAPFLGGACAPRPLSPSRASADLVGGGRELKRPLDAPPPCRRRCTAVLCFAHATGSAHRPRTQMPRGRCRLRSCTGAGLSGSGEGAHALRERDRERGRAWSSECGGSEPRRALALIRD